jgi:hypothetical protein
MLLLLALVPLLIVVVLLAVAALDGRGAERPRAATASTYSPGEDAARGALRVRDAVADVSRAQSGIVGHRVSTARLVNNDKHALPFNQR